MHNDIKRNSTVCCFHHNVITLFIFVFLLLALFPLNSLVGWGFLSEPKHSNSWNNPDPSLANGSNNFMLQKTFIASELQGCLFPPVLDQTHRERLSTGFMIYRPLYGKGPGTQHFLSSDIESLLPGVGCGSSVIVCKLICIAQFELVIALKFVFTFRVCWFQTCKKDSQGENLHGRQMAFTFWICGSTIIHNFDI